MGPNYHNQIFLNNVLRQGEGKKCKSLGETFKRDGPIIPSYQQKRRLLNLQKGIENKFKTSFVILSPIEMAENGQNHGNSSFVPPKDFRGCLLVHRLFSNFSIGNFLISYEFFKGILTY